MGTYNYASPANVVRYKVLLTQQIFDDNIATESKEIRGKIAEVLSIATKDGDFKVGDLKPIFFLKGDHEVLIGIKHPDETISLVEFDISKEKPEKGEKQVKAMSK